MTYRALLVGNSQFDLDPDLDTLFGPQKDVARLHGALTDTETGMFDDADVRLEYNLSKDSFRRVLDEFCSEMAKEDLLLFYYSGHGILDVEDEFYLATTDTHSQKLFHSALSRHELNGYLRSAASRRTVIVLDCCKSGMFKSGPLRPALGGAGRFVITSSTGQALADAARTPAGTSPFTEHLVEGLRGAAPDVDDDGKIDLREIFAYVKEQMGPQRVPHSIFDGDGDDVSLARTRVKPPAIAYARDTGTERVRTSQQGHYSRDATFALTEQLIALREVRDNEVLEPEVVRIQPLTDADLDLELDYDSGWLSADLAGDRLTVTMRPRLGANRGKILVRDRASRTTQVLRVEVYVRAATGTVRIDDRPRDPVERRDEGASAPQVRAKSARLPSAHHAPEPSSNPPSGPVQHNVGPPPGAQGFVGAPASTWGTGGVPQQPTPAAVPRTSKKAVWALIISITTFYWTLGVGSVTALILAAGARKDIRAGRPGAGLAKAATIIGWFGVAVAVVTIIALATTDTT
ncbi:caspase, EACC1-associated type [Luteipulveratus flavus]|uniref:Caspase family protein n=1 Tax=Luteipulveratus flavus TaxID=3031728 RepID=A0ABT6CBE9_9MICO|nr:caspase family protein [Luteipulveratus sp. YIM 133296]MDF8264596.1 caspase family protein [Luteipulveratus sp. YIM 133296]